MGLFKKCCVGFGLLMGCVATQTASAITIRHDVADSSYTSLAALSQYQSVGRLDITARKARFAAAR